MKTRFALVLLASCSVVFAQYKPNPYQVQPIQPIRSIPPVQPIQRYQPPKASTFFAPTTVPAMPTVRKISTPKPPVFTSGAKPATIQPFASFPGTAQARIQTIKTPKAKPANAQPSKVLGVLNANPYDPNSLQNPYGAGNLYKPDGLMNPYSENGSPYSPKSWTNPHATQPTKLVDSTGKYLGELSDNPYRPDSTSNPFGKYGSPFSACSVNNPYGAGNPFSAKPILVVPGGSAVK